LNLDSFLPLVYALLPGQSTEDYMRVLKILLELQVSAPRTLIQDFEMAELTAFQRVFPGVKVKIRVP
jgi:hypothetical protein